MRVCASPASPARGPRSPFAVSRPPNYLPLRSELNESRRVTSLSAVSPPPSSSDSHPRRAGGDRRQEWSRTSVSERKKEKDEREKMVIRKRKKGKRKDGKVLSGYFPYPKWLNLIPNSGSRARHKSRHKHPRCYFLFLLRIFLPDTRLIRHLLPRFQIYANF